MKFQTSPQSRRLLRNQRVGRWTGRLLLLAGVAAVAYVSIALLDAKLFQVFAKHSLESQIQIVGRAPEGPVTTIAKDGDIIGRIDIPRLGMSIAVLQGTRSRTLRRGAGHIDGTPLPGELGNSGIAGHRDTYFRGLKDVRKDDEIHFQTATRLVHYHVDWVKVVEPDDTTVLKSSQTESTLTLVTCYPFYFVGPAPSRFIVHARKQ
jgi:sortase A